MEKLESGYYRKGDSTRVESDITKRPKADIADYQESDHQYQNRLSAVSVKETDGKFNYSRIIREHDYLKCARSGRSLAFGNSPL